MFSAMVAGAVIIGAYVLRWMITTVIGRIVGIILLLYIIVASSSQPTVAPSTVTPSRPMTAIEAIEANRPYIRPEFSNPTTGQQGGCARSPDGTSMSCWSSTPR